MSSDRNSPPLAGAFNGDRRRGSVSGFVDLFGARSGSNANGDQRGASMFPGSIANAAAQAQQRRRLSLSTGGLSNSPNQQSPFSLSAGGRPRADSISSVSNAASLDESPFEEGDAPPGSIPSTAFGRRLSFGARAMRDMRTSNGNGSGNGNGNHRPSVVPGRKPSPPTASKHGRGSGPGTFDFAENLRSRAERGSIAGPSGPPQATVHHRAKSISSPEQPIREMPKQPRMPDAIQERMLRGDFYMD